MTGPQEESRLSVAARIASQRHEGYQNQRLVLSKLDQIMRQLRMGNLPESNCEGICRALFAMRIPAGKVPDHAFLKNFYVEAMALVAEAIREPEVFSVLPVAAEGMKAQAYQSCLS